MLRNSDVQQLFTDPRTRQSEKEFFELRGIQGGTLIDLFKYSMVTSNGSDHRRRRSAFSTAFAFRAMTDLRLYIRKVAVVEGGPVNAQQTGESPMSCTSDRKMVPSPFLKYLVHACVYRKPYPQ